MAGDPGLVDADPLDNIGDLPLAAPQRCDDQAARGVSEGLEDIYMCHRVYVYICIYNCQDIARARERVTTA
jgi:hypothetical protein